jgi:hypothetical protein
LHALLSRLTADDENQTAPPVTDSAAARQVTDKKAAAAATTVRARARAHAADSDYIGWLARGYRRLPVDWAPIGHRVAANGITLRRLTRGSD